MSDNQNLQSILQELKKNIPSWQNIEFNNTNFDRLSGLTNEMWKITLKNSSIEPQTIIFRRFGESGEFINRESENKIFQELSNEGISPGLYAATKDYRIEEFIDFKELESSLVNTPKFRLKIALVLKRLHSIKMELLDKTPMFKAMVLNQDIFKEFNTTLDYHSKNDGNIGKVDELKTIVSLEELEYIKNSLPTRSESNCFSHNDLHNRNMLYSPKLDKLVLIDFEYAGFNYKGYDIANLYNEAIIDYKVSEAPFYKIEISKFPTDLELVEFVQYYVIAGVLSNQEMKEIEKFEINQLKEFVKEKIEKFHLQEDIKNILREVRLCLMYSHFYWSVWSVIKSKGSGNKFDYMQFAFDRYTLYKKFKEVYNSNYALCFSVKDYSNG